MSYVEVYDLARGCEHVDEQWVRCSRRSSWAYEVRVANTWQVTLRCVDHRMDGGSKIIQEGRTLSLGYKP